MFAGLALVKHPCVTSGVRGKHFQSASTVIYPCQPRPFTARLHFRLFRIQTFTSCLLKAIGQNINRGLNAVDEKTNCHLWRNCTFLIGRKIDPLVSSLSGRCFCPMKLSNRVSSPIFCSLGPQ
jgi:hypothetical protein